MPWKSIQQARWGHSAAGEKALGGKAAVSEWDAATAKGSLPRRVSKKPVAKRKPESQSPTSAMLQGG